ncbi:hypothetical protein VMCG_03312 [Cytospora schulzeri]|uniref:Uncharacterized protein n=1 Tax=Cytospora schulzeri TaxID=448051 RepID=A0A423WY48_9PEZI|nr:hypothetical protein VMCG_03312 [Valsa malicola]
MTPPTKLNLKIPMPLPEFLHSTCRRARPSRLLSTPEEVEHVEFGEDQYCSSAQEATTQEAKEWIESMIRSSGRWDNHLSIIRIDCPHTTAELLELGRLPQPEGVKACRRMVRAPVIYDEIGCFLWEKLAEMERGPNFRMEDEEREAEYAREIRMKMTLANLDERFLFENPNYASEEKAAEIAWEMGPKTTTLSHLDERFLFDTPKYSSGDKDRTRQDSDPISPLEVRKHPQDDCRKRSPCRPPHSPKACHFCGHDSICENTDVLKDIRSESLNATRGHLAHHKPQQKTQGQGQSQYSHPTPAQARPTGSTNHGRRSSYASTLIWHRDHAPSLCSSRKLLPRSNSLTGKVVHVVGNLGKNVGSTVGRSLSHGYGYAGRRERTGSADTTGSAGTV